MPCTHYSPNLCLQVGAYSFNHPSIGSVLQGTEGLMMSKVDMTAIVMGLFVVKSDGLKYHMPHWLSLLCMTLVITDHYIR